MLHFVFTVLLMLLPAVAFFSGMAMTPALLIFALLAFWLVPNADKRSPLASLPNHRMLLLGIALLLVWPVVTSLWSILPLYSLGIGLRALVLATFGLLAIAYAPSIEAPAARVLKGFSIALLVVAGCVLLEKLPDGGPIATLFDLLHQDHYKFIMKDVNRGLCALTVFIWPLVLGYQRLGETRRGWIMWAITAVAIMIMHSLSAKVGLVAGVAAYFAIRRWPEYAPRALKFLLPLYVLSFPVLFIAAENTFFALPVVQEHLPPSGIHRLSIWHELMVKVAEKPVQGWGVDTTRAMPFTPEVLEKLHVKEPPLHPHSPALQLLLEQGIIGLFLSAAGLFVLLREWVRMPREDALARTSMGALIVSYFVSGVSSFGVWQFWWIAVLWIGFFLWRYFGRVKTA